MGKLFIFENFCWLTHSISSKAVYIRCFLFRSTKSEVKMVLPVDFKKIENYPGTHTDNDERYEISMEGI